jgi:HD-like signal output (HDOD) protein
LHDNTQLHTTVDLMPVTAARPPSNVSRRAVLAASIKRFATWTEWVESDEWPTAISASNLALPSNASDIMVLALDPDVSVAQLVHVTSRDQVLAARMLRLANSAYCAPLEEITTISDAVVRLGTASVRNVVLATCMASRLQHGSAYGPQGAGLAAHGIGSAFLCQALAKHAGVNAEEAFLYGLVHDLGKLLVLQLAKDYTGAGGTVDPAEVAAMIAKRHAEFGGRMLADWRLPSVIQQPVVHHHQPQNCQDHPVEAAAVYLANQLSHRYGFGCNPAPDLNLLADPVAGQIGIDGAWLADMDANAPELMQGALAAFA